MGHKAPALVKLPQNKSFLPLKGKKRPQTFLILGVDVYMALRYTMTIKLIKSRRKAEQINLKKHLTCLWRYAIIKVTKLISKPKSPGLRVG